MSRLIGSAVDNTPDSLSNAVRPSPVSVCVVAAGAVKLGAVMFGASMVGAAGDSGDGDNIDGGCGATTPPAGANALGSRLSGLE